MVISILLFVSVLFHSLSISDQKRFWILDVIPFDMISFDSDLTHRYAGSNVLSMPNFM